MIDPWFDPIQYSYLPGTIFGTTIGLWGALMGCLCGYRTLFAWLIISGCLLLAASIILLILGIIALKTGQPYGIWYAFLLPGIQGSFMLPFFLWLLRSRRLHIELNAMMAEDLRDVSR